MVLALSIGLHSKAKHTLATSSRISRFVKLFLDSVARGRACSNYYYFHFFPHFSIDTLAHTINDIDNYCDKISASIWLGGMSNVTFSHATLVTGRSYQARFSSAVPESCEPKNYWRPLKKIE